MNSLQKILEKLPPEIRERCEAAEQAIRESDNPIETIRKMAEKSSNNGQTAEIVEFLPRWAADQRGAPNAFLRSALFGVVKRGRRAHVEKMEIPTQGGIRLTYSGIRHNQASFSVWLELIRLASEQNTLRVEFSMFEILKKIGKSTGKANYEWLDREITRLRGGTIELSDGSRTYGGGLIHDYFRDEDTGRYVVILNEKLLPFFGPSSYTRLEFQQRSALSSDLALWLHGFYSTHAKPHPLRVDTLHKLCGSEMKELRFFRAELKKALAELGGVTGWSCSLDEGGLCRVVKDADTV